MSNREVNDYSCLRIIRPSKNIRLAALLHLLITLTTIFLFIRQQITLSFYGKWSKILHELALKRPYSIFYYNFPPAYRKYLHRLSTYGRRAS